MTDLDPRRLLIFREVARRGSLSAAAEALGWTQPAVGQHIQRLERDTGLPLVTRRSRGVTPTDAGRRLLVHADALSSRLAAAQEEMRSMRELRTGSLHLAAFPSASATLVPDLLRRMAVDAPGVDVRLAELEPPEAREAVLAGDVDLAVLFHHGEPDAHPDLSVTTLLEDPVRIVLPRDHDLATNDVVDLADLTAERWVGGCPRCRRHLESLAASAGFVPDIRHTTDDYVVVQNLVAAGLAVAVLPTMALRANVNDRVAVRPVRGDPVRHVTVAHRRESAGVPAVTAALAALVDPALSTRPRP